MSQVYPQPTPYVVIQQPIQNANPFRTMNNEWHADLCSCCNNTQDCCYAYWCWCCFLGTLANSIDESKWSCLCIPNALAMYRTKIRTALQIRGSTCNDYCATSCCGFCAGLQMYNELKFRGLS